MSNLQDKRAKFFNSKMFKGPTREIKVDEDLTLEVRSPQAKYAFEDKAPTIEELILECVYDPESGQPFFEKENLEELKKSSIDPNGFVSKLTDAITEISGVEVEEGN